MHLHFLLNIIITTSKCLHDVFNAEHVHDNLWQGKLKASALSLNLSNWKNLQRNVLLHGNKGSWRRALKNYMLNARVEM
jgi:hypothetical protein